MVTETRCLSIAIDYPQPSAYAWLRQPGMTDERFAAAAKLVRKDLAFAKKILESGPGRWSREVA